MSFLFNNVAAIAVALTASAVVWVFGGTRGDLLLRFVPWMCAFLVEVLVCFPQRHRGETTYEARARAWRALKRDAVFWVALGLFALLLVPFANNGLCPGCDAKAIALGIDPRPPVPFLPFCVSRIDHLNVVLWFAVALLPLVIVRHCLTGRGKRTVLELIVWNGLAVAVFGFVQAATGARAPFWLDGEETGPVTFFSTFGYPNMGGDYFTTLFGVSVALWRNCCENVRRERADGKGLARSESAHAQFWRMHYFLIPSAVFFFAALNTFSRASILLVTAIAIVSFAHAMITALHRMRRAPRILLGIWSLIAFGLIVFLASLFMPKSLQKELDTVDATEVLDRVTGRGQYHVRVATELWKDHLLFGCGGWGYSHLCVTKMTPDERKNLQGVGGSNVHNDYLQFLAEHGVFGFGAMVALVVLLLWPVVRGWKRLVRKARFKKGQSPQPVQVFALPAPAFSLLAALVATLIHAFGDCPFRSPAVLMLFYVVLAAIPGFMPKQEDDLSS